MKITNRFIDKYNLSLKEDGTLDLVKFKEECMKTFKYYLARSNKEKDEIIKDFGTFLNISAEDAAKLIVTEAYQDTSFDRQVRDLSKSKNGYVNKYTDVISKAVTDLRNTRGNDKTVIAENGKLKRENKALRGQMDSDAFELSQIAYLDRTVAELESEKRDLIVTLQAIYEEVETLRAVNAENEGLADIANDLRDRVNELESQVIVDGDLEKLRETIAKLEKQNELANSELKIAREDNVRISKMIDEAYDKVDRVMAENELLAVRNRELTNENISLKDQLTKKDVRIQDLEDVNARLEKDKTEILRALNIVVNQAENVRAKYAKDNKELRATVDQLRQNMFQIEKNNLQELGKANETIATLRRIIIGKQLQINALNKQPIKIDEKDKKSFEQAADYADKKIQQLENEKKSLASLNELQKNRIAELTTGKEASDADVKKYKKSTTVLGVLSSILGVTLAVSAIANIKQGNTIDTLQSVNDGYVQTIQGLEGELANLQNSLAEANKTISGLENEISDLTADLDIYEKTSVDASSIFDVLKAVLTDEQIAAVQNEDGTINVDALIAQDGTGVIAQVVASYISQNARIDAYEDIFSTVIGKLGIEVLNEDGTTAKATLDNFRSEDGQVDTEKLSIALNSFIDARIDEINASINEIMANAMVIGNEVYGLDVMQQEQISDLNDLKTSLDALRSQISEYVKEVDGLKAELSETQELLNQAQAENEELKKENEELEKENQELNDKIENSNSGTESGEQTEVGSGQGSTQVGDENQNKEDGSTTNASGSGNKGEISESTTGEITRG